MEKTIYLQVEIRKDVDLEEIVKDCIELSKKIGIPVRFNYRCQQCEVNQESNISMADYQFNKTYSGQLVEF